LSVGGDAIADAQWQDVVIVPPLSTSVVRIAFENHSGNAVYHCHILDHEDAGMMGIIRAK
jgi:FtsP/CotA-like multicopper oxidase with cupredoxin domain